MPEQLDSWCRGVLNKRGADGVRVCIDILQAGVKYGRMSANDVRDVHFDEPNVIGAVFKACAGRCGFRKADPLRDPPPYIIKSDKRSRHSGESRVWILAERYKAERALRAFRSLLFTFRESNQGVLAI